MNKLKKNLEEYLESDCGDGMLLLIGKDEAELILKVFKALDKACQKLWIAEGMMFKEHSMTQ